MSIRVMADELFDALVRARIVTANEAHLIRKISIVMEPLKPVQVHIEKHTGADVTQVIRELGRIEPIETEG